MECTKAEIWERLKALLIHSQTDKEVWLVLGNMLEASKFESGLRKTTPDPECLQMHHLLQTTLSALGQVNVKVRVLCSKDG